MAKAAVPEHLKQKYYRVIRDIYESCWPQLVNKKLSAMDIAKEIEPYAIKAGNDVIDARLVAFNAGATTGEQKGVFNKWLTKLKPKSR